MSETKLQRKTLEEKIDQLIFDVSVLKILIGKFEKLNGHHHDYLLQSQEGWFSTTAPIIVGGN